MSHPAALPNSPSPWCVAITDPHIFLRGRTVTPTPPSWPAKDPSEIVLCQADFAPRLRPGAVIVQIGVDVSPAAAVAVLAAGLVGTIVTLRLAGGIAGQEVAVAITAVLRDGQRLVGTVMLPVLTTSAAAVPVSSALTLNGLPLTVGGKPLAVSSADQPLTLDDNALAIGTTPLSLGT